MLIYALLYLTGYEDMTIEEFAISVAWRFPQAIRNLPQA